MNFQSHELPASSNIHRRLSLQVSVYLCLLDIASGMQYLHSLGIMHSGGVGSKMGGLRIKVVTHKARSHQCLQCRFLLPACSHTCRPQARQRAAEGRPQQQARLHLQAGRLWAEQVGGCWLAVVGCCWHEAAAAEVQGLIVLRAFLFRLQDAGRLRHACGDGQPGHAHPRCPRAAQGGAPVPCGRCVCFWRAG